MNQENLMDMEDTVGLMETHMTDILRRDLEKEKENCIK